MGAISELRSRLSSEDVGAAAGAYNALSDSAGTDISSVAQAAERAMQDVRIRPKTTKLSFAPVEQGSGPRTT